jgi:putative Holliday junction resolvase
VNDATARPVGTRVLGVDLGTKRIGLALSDTTRTIASPHTVLTRAAAVSDDHAAICKIVRDEGVDTVVVGLPLSLSGRSGPAARAARIEIDALARALVGIAEVRTHDERLTTVSAERALRAARVTKHDQRALVDKVAAAVMLQAFLDGEAARPGRVAT